MQIIIKRNFVFVSREKREHERRFGGEYKNVRGMKGVI